MHLLNTYERKECLWSDNYISLAAAPSLILKPPNLSLPNKDFRSYFNVPGICV